MTQFFTDASGVSYPVSRIISIRASRWSSPPKPLPAHWRGFAVRLDGVADPVFVSEFERDDLGKAPSDRQRSDG